MGARAGPTKNPLVCFVCDFRCFLSFFFIFDLAFRVRDRSVGGIVATILYIFLFFIFIAI